MLICTHVVTLLGSTHDVMRYMTVKSVLSTHLKRMLGTDLLYLYLVHHELDSVIIVMDFIIHGLCRSE